MLDHTPLVTTIVVGIGIAFLLGAIANRLRISPLVGYLLAGVVVGPYTPGFVADQSLANQLAEIGVILLMFGVGMHFSLQGPAVGEGHRHPRRAGPHALVATLLGMGLAWLLGWNMARRLRVRPGAVGRQHSRAAARAAGAAAARQRVRAGSPSAG